MDIRQQLRDAAADGAALREALAGAEIMPLLMSFVQLTGRTERLDEVRPYVAGAWSFQQAVPQALQDRIREELAAAIEEAAASGRDVPPEPPEALIGRMMETAVGQPVPEIYKPVFREEMGFGGVDHRDVAWRKADRPRQDGFQVVVIGAGFSGIAMAIKLKQAGIPFVVIEKNDDVGGTWLENTYPGCGVDTPCHFYSYSFDFNPDWTSYFVKRDELRAYILRCVDRFSIRAQIRFGEEVEEARYDEARASWAVRTRRQDGQGDRIECHALVSAVGALNRPAIPNIPGLNTFGGSCLHTARWDRSVDLAGKRVAMIGTGASGIQLAPAIAPGVERLTIFQRSPHWVIHHPLYHADVAPAVRWAMRHVPFYANWFRFQLFWAASDGFHPTLRLDPDWTDPSRSLNAANAKLRKELIAYASAELGDRQDLLAKVIPDYPPFGKRMLRDTHWFRMLRRPNVDLVTERLERVERDAVVAAGVRYPVDAIALATGFQAARMLWPMTIAGRGGTTLRDLWGEDDPRAHLGITVPGFPNFFLLYGPNTNLAHGGSAIFHSECQVRYVMLALRELVEGEADALEVRQDAFEAYNMRVDAKLRQMVWSHPGVTNWYKNRSGRVIMNSPWRLVDYRNLTAELDLSEYRLDRVTAKAGA